MTSPQHSPYAIYTADAPPGAVSVAVDPFAPEFFDDPYPMLQQIRDAGPFVWLSRYCIGAVARYDQVRQTLLDWQTFSSARGVGMEDFERHGRFRLPSLILEADPPQHTRSRAVLNRAVSPASIQRLRAWFTQEAETLVDSLVERRRFDGIKDLAEVFPLRVFPDAMGMAQEGREKLLPHAEMMFNSFGPRNELFQQSLGGAAFEWIEEQGQRHRLSANGIGAVVHEAADRGEISAEEAPRLVRGLLQAGLDTTINGIGAALYCLARFPHQWDRLRESPAKARAAFEEAVRFESPVQTFFRTTTRPARIGTVPLREGDKILMFLAGANRDPRKWPNPDVYDIDRQNVGHVGFGAGIHMCVGQMLARLEGEVVLAALASRIQSLEITGTPERRFNNTLRGLKNLPLEIKPR